MGLPLVAVLPTKMVPGLGSLTRVEAPPEPVPVLRLDEALAKCWETDAHLLCYLAYERGTPSIKHGSWRLRKEILGELRGSGADVFLAVLCIDIDNPEHAPWDATGLVEFEERFAALPQKLTPAFAYRTAHGARFLYIPDEPLVAEEAEEVVAGLVLQLQELGWTPDEKCGDWTRCFRMPMVTRDGAKTWESSYFWVADDFARRLNTKLVPHVSRPKAPTSPAVTGVPNPADDPKPDRDEAIALIERRGAAGRPAMTEFAKRAKFLLSGRDSYRVVFEHGKIAEKGSRDSTLMRLVGESAALLHDEKGYTPDHLYGMFVRAAEELEPDEDTPDWTDKLWYAVGYCWRQQEAAAAKKRVAQVEQAKVQMDLVSQMTAGMATWCKAPELADPSSPLAKAFMLRHILVSTGRSYYMMGPDGWYSGVPIVRETHIPARIREAGLEGVIQLTEMDGKTIRPRTIQSLLNDHLTFAKMIEGSLSADRCYLDNLGGEDSRFVVSLFRLRTDVTPRFDQNVHRWMELLVGEDRVEELQRWIAWALDFREGPICALSLAGPPGVGKKMLAMGLAECITTERIAPGVELVQQFPQSLLETCFMVVDEGLPSQTRGGLDIADNFRRLVGGDPQLVDRKFLDKIVVRNPMRIVFTANNLDVVQQLARHRNLSQDDQAALAQRILHMPASGDAAIWLRSKGGTRFTRGWIRGDSGEASDYVVAGHFLYLYQERHRFARDSRLLVEGRLDQSFLDEMRTNSGSAPVVVENLVMMIEAKNQERMDGLVIQGSKLFASAAGVVDYARCQSWPERGTIDHRKVAHVFRGLMVAGEEHSLDGPREMKALSGRRVKARWWQLDPVVLLKEAIRHGLPSERLLGMVRQIDTEEAKQLVGYAEAQGGEV